MKTFNYKPKNPVFGSITTIGISLFMIIFPLIYPFGISLGRVRILPPSVVTIIFVIGGAFLLYCTIQDIRKARALSNSGGGVITVDGDEVSYPAVVKKAIVYLKFNISDIQFVKYDESEHEFEIAMLGARVRLDTECFDDYGKFEEFRALLGK